LGKKKPSFLRLRKLGKFSVPQKVKLFKEKRILGKKRIKIVFCGSKAFLLRGFCLRF